MPEYDRSSNSEVGSKPAGGLPQQGRFIVEMPGERRVGLTVEETSLLLETPEGREAVVYRIHRVCEDGRMELVGVSEASLRRRTCIVYYRVDVREARLDFDRIAQLAMTAPPPCRIELRLLRESSPHGASLVVLKFAEACADAIHTWLGTVNRTLGDPSGGRPMTPDDLDAASLQVVKDATFEPSRIER